MAEILTSDNSVPSEVMESQVSDEAESLRIGEEMIEAQEQKLAGKYSNTEELEAAYLELQKKLGSQEDDSYDEYDEESDDYDYSFLDDAIQSINESGQISDDLLDQIGEMDSVELFAAMANQDIQVSRDLSEGELSAVYDAVGGQDQYASLIDWAQDNFSEAEIEAYDATVESGNLSQINLALQALYYRYTDAVGQDGTLLQGKPAQAEAAYRSQAELIKAMNDPRYDNDPAYRQDVLNKLDRSDINF